MTFLPPDDTTRYEPQVARDLLGTPLDDTGRDGGITRNGNLVRSAACIDCDRTRPFLEGESGVRGGHEFHPCALFVETAGTVITLDRDSATAIDVGFQRIPVKLTRLVLQAGPVVTRGRGSSFILKVLWEFCIELVFANRHLGS